MEEIVMQNLSVPQQQILKYLHVKWEFMPEWISPTQIGKDVGGSNRHSAWASPKCISLAKKGLIDRSINGTYMINKKGINLYREWVRSLTNKREDKVERS